GVLLAVGAATPLYRVVLAVYPGLDRFRFPVRFLYPVMIAASVLAAYGLDAIVGAVRPETARRRAATLVAGSLVALSLGLLSPPGHWVRAAWDHRRHLALASLIALL